MRHELHQMGLVSPVDEKLARNRQVASPLPNLQGVVAGFLDNRKNNADQLLARIRDVLQAQYAVTEVVWRAKFIYSRTAASEILEDLAARCRFVVTAIGD